MTQNTLHFNVSLTPQWTIMILVNWLNFKRNEIYEKGTGNIGSGRHRLHRQSSETGTDSVLLSFMTQPNQNILQLYLYFIWPRTWQQNGT